ncbi:transglutaminase-like domain-containing protein [Flavobacterium sp.]|uniref:transglutaminase-like domain-containing protein n=1 Tax=Flavobacterium sp. TaxID=239 RepID=UPI0037533109
MNSKQETYYFDFSIKRFGFRFEFKEEVFKYFNNLPKYVLQQPNWEIEYYNMFLNNDLDIPILRETLAKTQRFLGTNPDILALGVTRFVQGGLLYDYDKLKESDWGAYYPYETLYLGKGVCMDKSFLLAKLLILLDFKVVLLAYKKNKHMTVGIQVSDGLGNYQTPTGSFALIESTGYNPIGIISPIIENNEEPIIIYPKKNGTKLFTKIKELRENEEKATRMYGKVYVDANAYQKNILIKIKELEGKAKQIEYKLKAESNIIAYNILADSYNKINRDINVLIGYFNQG